MPLKSKHYTVNNKKIKKHNTMKQKQKRKTQKNKRNKRGGIGNNHEHLLEELKEKEREIEEIKNKKGYTSRKTRKMKLYYNENGNEITADKAYHPDYMDKDEKEILLEILNEERDAILKKLPKNIKNNQTPINQSLNNTQGYWNNLPKSTNPFDIFSSIIKSKNNKNQRTAPPPPPPPVPTIEQQLESNINTLQQQINQDEIKLQKISSQNNYLTTNSDNTVYNVGTGYPLNKYGQLIKNDTKEKNEYMLINKIKENESNIKELQTTLQKLQNKLFKERQRQRKNREQYLQNEIKKRLKKKTI